MRSLLLLFLISLLISLVGLAPTVEAGGEKRELWLPLQYLIGRWAVRPVSSSVSDLFNLSPYELNIDKAGPVHQGVLVGELSIRRDDQFFTAALFGGEEGVGATSSVFDQAKGLFQGEPDEDEGKQPKRRSTSIITADKNETTSGEELHDDKSRPLVVPFRIETDPTLFGGSVVLGEGHEQEEEELAEGTNQIPSSSSSKLLTYTTPYNFHRSLGDFHPFKTVIGTCPSPEEIISRTDLLLKGEGEETKEKDKFFGPLKQWMHLVQIGENKVKEEKKVDEDHDEKEIQGEMAAKQEEQQLEKWQWCRSYQLVVLDENSFQLSIQMLGSEAERTLTFHVSRKKYDPREDKGIWTFIWTGLFLIFVAAVKFGPKYYFKYKGLDPKVFTDPKKMEALRKRAQLMDPKERKRLETEQKEILAKMEKEGLLAQEREQRELAQEGREQQKQSKEEGDEDDYFGYVDSDEENRAKSINSGNTKKRGKATKE